MANPNDIQNRIAQALPTAQVQVLDPMQDGNHLQAIVVSTDFEDKSALERHRLVYAALGNVFDTSELHALQLKTLTPGESEPQNSSTHVI